VTVFLDHPFGIAGDGRTATASAAGHVRDLVEQVLFTAPGERVNRPDFGSGLGGLVFEPNSDALAAAVRARVEGSLHQWLSDVVAVEGVSVEPQDTTLTVVVRYVVRATGERTTATFRDRGQS
jgi:phage baseplate assembly protein W